MSRPSRETDERRLAARERLWLDPEWDPVTGYGDSSREKLGEAGRRVPRPHPPGTDAPDPP